MQKGREIQDNIFGSRSFGLHGSMMSMPSLFGGRDPFDDPFFTEPFHRTMFGPSSAASGTMQKTSRDKGIVIEELGSDDEEGNHVPETGDKDDFDPKKIISTVEPSVEHPDDDDVNADVTFKNDHHKIEPPKASNFSFQSSRVTYGGVDGAYYTSTRTRRIGVDGAIIEENKEADSTTGQATHRITRGINDKGHSVLKKLDSDGKVDTSQTLHNLNEDELPEFEEAWKGNNIGQLSGWKGGYNVHRNEDVLDPTVTGEPPIVGEFSLSPDNGKSEESLISKSPRLFHTFHKGGEVLSRICKVVIELLVSWYNVLASKFCHGSGSGKQNRNQVWAPLPSSEQAGRAKGFASNYETGTSSSGRTKKVIRINIE